MGHISTRRKNAFNIFRESRKLGSFDEFPMLRPEVDLQLHQSRNEVDQPFHLICERDSVIAQMSGKAVVEFTDGPVRYFELEPGDYVYVPGGMAHRIRTIEAGDQFRYKAQFPGLEATIWLCEGCGAEIDRHVWDVAETLPQAGYHFACERHNAEEKRRQCAGCGKIHDKIDLAPFRWNDIAEALAREDEEA